MRSLLREREMARAGAPPKNNRSHDMIDYRGAETLAELGISRDQSSQWQRLAAIPEREFEQAVVQPREPAERSSESIILEERHSHAASSSASLQRSRCGRALIAREIF
jgi:hypothetical protein